MHKISNHTVLDTDKVIFTKSKSFLRNISIKAATHPNIDFLIMQYKHTMLKPSDNTSFHCRFSGTHVAHGHAESPELGSLWLGVVL